MVIRQSVMYCVSFSHSCGIHLSPFHYMSEPSSSASALHIRVIGTGCCATAYKEQKNRHTSPTGGVIKTKSRVALQLLLLVFYVEFQRQLLESSS